MGLDVYVGTLTRYQTRDWETIVQRAAQEMGVSFEVRPPDGEPQPRVDPTELEPLVGAWRESLNASLANHISGPLEWREGMAPPYFTDKPAWDGYSALLIWAAHEEHPGSPLPDVAPDDQTADAAVRRSQAEGFSSRYGQLLYGAEMWLPGDFAFTSRAPDPTGAVLTLGFTGTLAAELRDLNQHTWRARTDTVAQWRVDGADAGAPLERSARFGYAVFDALAQVANQEQLPMRLDYQWPRPNNRCT